MAIASETGYLFCDDNLRRLSGMPTNSVDLVYLDPPFFSNRYYEVIWGDEAEVRSFEDRWAGGIDAYIEWMQERMIELQRVLKPTGTIYLHCDSHAGHYLKVMMDGIFGSRNFLNEIVWHYQTSSGAPKKWLHRNHDVILRYAATSPKKVTWHHPRSPWPESTLRKWQRDEHGRVYRQQGGTRYYVDPAGKLDDDVWPITLASRSSERIGYPTQKPEALLERIIRASSNPGDVVLDPFCGCGTTIAVAHKLQRQWIGIDISPTAVGIMRTRVEKLGAHVEVDGLAMTEADLREFGPFEFQNWVLQRVSATPSARKTHDMGIDGLSFMEHLPIQIKRSDVVGRDVLDAFQTAIERSGKHAGYVVAFSFTRGARQEAARARRAGKPSIGLIEVGELIRFATAIEGANLVELAELFNRNTLRRPETPDLLRLFSASARPPSRRPLPDALSKKAKPKLTELIASARAT